MKKVLSVKSWILNKNPQFKMAGPGQALRLKDNYSFSNRGDILSIISYCGRFGCILEFMSNYVHVQIEVRKADAPYYTGIEFDSEHYEVIEVPINEIGRRMSFQDDGKGGKKFTLNEYDGKGESRNK